MAEEGYEAYHVPQQSRRDKLRVVAGQNQPTLVESPSTATTALLPHHASSSSSLLPLYDPSSLIPSDLLTCAPQHGNFHPHHHHHSNSNNSNCAVKEEQRSSNLIMAFSPPPSANNNNNNNSSSVSHHHHQGNSYNLDLPEPSNFPNLNPGASIHIFGTPNHNGNNNNCNNPFLYHHLHQPPPQPQNLMSDIMVFKPEPLSLSLSSQHHRNSSNSNLPLELNLERYNGVIPGLVVGGGNNNSSATNNGVIGGSSVSNEGSRSAVVLPMGPFTGYASVLKGSRFLKPAKELLEELCDVGGAGVCVVGGGGGDDDVAADAGLMMMEPPPPSYSMDQCLNGGADHQEDLGDHHGVEGRNKSRLLTMLDEVYRRYRQYYQQMHAVVTSFEYVSGLSNAAPYASLAIKTMSKHFRCLKNAITDQLQFTNKAQYHLSNRKDESPRFGNTDRGPYGQRSGFIEHQPVWRPQRGLPERAVTVLRAWLFEHFLHPYPTDTDKLMLAKQTGLSRSQVSNWFINARVRLWKPMVEEIHMLETRQGQKNPQREEHSRNRSSDHLPSLDSSLVSENPSTSADRFQDAPYKQRTMNELPSIPVRSQEQLNLPCTGNQPVGVGVSMAGSASNSVSLTLGLHQNHGIGLAEPFPLSAAQRFGLGLETNNEGYVMNGFESQNRHFGRDVIGGQLLHDFVG